MIFQLFMDVFHQGQIFIYPLQPHAFATKTLYVMNWYVHVLVIYFDQQLPTDHGP